MNASPCQVCKASDAIPHPDKPIVGMAAQCKFCLAEQPKTWRDKEPLL